MLAGRRRFMLLVVGAMLALTVIVTLLSPKIWTATTDIYIDYRETDLISGRAISPFLDDNYMKTQLDLLQSQRVVEIVIDALKLRSYPEYREALAKHGEQRANLALITTIRENTKIQRDGGSRVVSVSYSGDSPEQARQFADAIANAYIGLNEEVSSSAARQRFEQYNAQLDNLRHEIDDIQGKLTEYQQSTGILNVREHGDLESQKLAEMTKTLLAVQTRMEEVRTRNQATQKLLDSGVPVQEIPQINQLPSLGILKEQLGRLDLQLGERQGSLGPNHPTIKGLYAERQRTIAAIRREAQVTLKADQDEVVQLQAQAESLEKDIDQQRQKVLEQMQQRDRIAAYQRQFAGAQQVYNAALEKYDTVIMAGSVNALSASVLQAADLPTSPSRPKPLVNLLLGLLSGMAVAACLALLLELLNRRVRCPEDLLSFRSAAPLLGRIG